jgi:hypothetical protein
MKSGSKESKEQLHCENDHVIAAATVDTSVLDNHTKFCQEMRAVH